MVNVFFKLCIIFRGYADNNGVAGFNFFNVTERFLIDMLLRCQGDDGHAFHDESECAVFQFTGSVCFRMDVGNFFEF